MPQPESRTSRQTNRSERSALSWATLPGSATRTDRVVTSISPGPSPIASAAFRTSSEASSRSCAGSPSTGGQASSMRSSSPTPVGSTARSGPSTSRIASARSRGSKWAAAEPAKRRSFASSRAAAAVAPPMASRPLRSAERLAPICSARIRMAESRSPSSSTVPRASVTRLSRSSVRAPRRSSARASRAIRCKSIAACIAPSRPARVPLAPGTGMDPAARLLLQVPLPVHVLDLQGRALRLLVHEAEVERLGLPAPLARERRRQREPARGGPVPPERGGSARHEDQAERHEQGAHETSRDPHRFPSAGRGARMLVDTPGHYARAACRTWRERGLCVVFGGHRRTRPAHGCARETLAASHRCEAVHSAPAMRVFSSRPGRERCGADAMVTRILLVERNAGDYRTLRAELERLGKGHELERAATAYEGLDRLRRARFDVLVLDLEPTGAAGAEVVRRFRDRHPLLPIVVLTTAGDDRAALHALEAGAQDCVVKHDLAAAPLWCAIR